MVSYVMIQGDLDAEDTKNRTEYSVNTLTDQGIRVQKLTEVSGNWEESRGKELTEQALKRYGRRVEVIICNNDAMANGASEAIQEAGRVVGKDICLVGVDGLRSTVTAVRDGYVTGTVLNDYHGQAKKAAEVLMKLGRWRTCRNGISDRSCENFWKWSIEFVLEIAAVTAECFTVATVQFIHAK